MHTEAISPSQENLSGVLDFIKQKKDCLVPSGTTVDTVYRIVNYNAGADTKDGDKPIYSLSDVKAILKAFYEIRCEGWGYAPSTTDEQKVIDEVARRSKENTDLVRVVLYELYYAHQRNDIYDYPPQGKVSQTSVTGATNNQTASNSSQSQPGTDTGYTAPSEGGGKFIDQLKAGFKSPFVWGTAIIAVAGYAMWKFVPANKKGLSDRRYQAKRKHQSIMDKYNKSLQV
jgi:hypothetical protein